MERTHTSQPDEALRQATGIPAIDEPATPAACAADYQASTAERADSEKRDANARRTR